MNRKQFIESLGATCKNWTWSWSFVNEKEKIVIFGAWDRHDDGKMSLILSARWAINQKGQKTKGYSQSREHIRLVKEEGYKLKTFPMEYSEENKDVDGIGPAKIGGFTPEIKKKELIRVGEDWYASDDKTTTRIRIPEEVPVQEQYIEGTRKKITVNAYERNSKGRAACLAHYGYKCIVCDFDFRSVYGEIGQNYIHVHHLIPISKIKKEYILDPINDLVPVCPNCHAMIHKTEPALEAEALKEEILKNKMTKLSDVSE